MSGCGTFETNDGPAGLQASIDSLVAMWQKCTMPSTRGSSRVNDTGRQGGVDADGLIRILMSIRISVLGRPLPSHRRQMLRWIRLVVRRKQESSPTAVTKKHLSSRGSNGTRPRSVVKRQRQLQTSVCISQVRILTITHP